MRNKYELNALSLIEGGDTIKITFRNGTIKIYNNIKHVEAYVAKVISECEYTIGHIEVEEEKQIVVKEWKTIFGRSRTGVMSLNPEI
jgi:hypothetical protein